MTNDVTGKGASLRERAAELLASAINMVMAGAGMRGAISPSNDGVLYYVDEILALTHPTEPPSAGREGWRLVSEEPPIEMIIAGQQSWLEANKWEARRVYRAMLAAAPSPEPQPSGRLDREEKP